MSNNQNVVSSYLCCTYFVIERSLLYLEYISENVKVIYNNSVL